MANDSNGQAHLFPLSPGQVWRALMAANKDPGPTANEDGPWLVPPWGHRFPRGARHRIDVDAECGYLEEGEISADHFKSMYTRWGIAARVVDIWPDECWAAYPEIYDSEDPKDTPFETGVRELDERCLLKHYMHRLDRLSGVGQYAVMFYGFDDGGRLDRPPAGIHPDTGELLDPNKPVKLTLNYVRVFDQTLVRISGTEKNAYNPRYGQPKYYSVQFASTAAAGVGPGPSVPGPNMVENKVHWTRIQPLADNLRSSEIYGTPRLLPVLNYLYDLRKVVGGSAEMFWRGGFPGYAFKTYPDLAGDAVIDEESLRKAMWGYQNGMQRYLATVGGEWQSLQPQVADPKSHCDWYVKLICATGGYPTSVFLGTERGNLASQKDTDRWQSACNGRQAKHLEPRLVRPVYERLVRYGCLPKPQDDRFYAHWRDLRALSEKDKADVALKKVQALQTFFTGNIDHRFPTRLLLTLVMGFTEAEADAIDKEMEKNAPPEGDLLNAKVAPNAGGGRTGSPNKGPVGRPKGGPAQGASKSTTGSTGRSRRMSLHVNRMAPDTEVLSICPAAPY